MEFLLLGRFEAYDGSGRPLVLGRRRERCLLGLLLLQPGHAITAQRLTDLLWEDSPPRNPAAALRTYVSRLRSALAGAGPIRLISAHGGYLAEVGPETVDAHRFTTLVGRARDAPDAESRARLLDRALSLWRGPLLAGTGTDTLRDRVGAELTELQLLATRMLVEARLSLGEHDEVIGTLSGLVAEHHLDESLVSLLMLGLYRAGRPAEALQAYEGLRTRLAETLGSDPGQEVQQRYLAILRQDPVLDPQPVASAAAPPVVRQLPADITHFVGRTPESAVLDAAVANCAHTAAVVVISGMGGVGKTALALHWAHRVAGGFPDGQLYIDLHGFHPGGQIVAPATALHRFLLALGVKAETVPVETEARAQLFRSLLSGRRMLVVLDNAHDADHVRPLLPGSVGCLALVTSRNSLTSLVAIEQAKPVPLDVLADGEATELLRLRIGARRMAAEPIAARAMVERCAGLPLALAILAARAAVSPQATLGSLVAEPDGETVGLSGLYGGDLSADVRAVFASSYGAVSAPAARLFRLLGLHPGGDIGIAAAARLADLPVARTRELLDELCGMNLVRLGADGRYSCHDLLSAYARELSDRGERPADRGAAITRLLDHYLHRAHAASRHLHAPRGKLTLPDPRAPVAPFAGADEAREWFHAERAAMVAAICELDSHEEYLWPLAQVLTMNLERQGWWSDLLATSRRSLDITERLGDLWGQADACRNHAMAVYRLLDYEGSLEYYEREVALRRRLGDRAGEARVIIEMAGVNEMLGRYREALDQAHKSLELARLSGSRAGETSALNGIGWLHAHLAEYAPALEYCRAAADLADELGLPTAKADAVDSLGYILRGLGRFDEAVAHYQRAAVIYRDADDMFTYAAVLDCIGDCLQASGDGAEAQKVWSEAVAVFESLHHPEAERIRIKSRERK